MQEAAQSPTTQPEEMSATEVRLERQEVATDSRQSNRAESSTSGSRVQSMGGRVTSTNGGQTAEDGG